MNTLDQYTETIIDQIVTKRFFEKKEKFEKRKAEAKKMLYEKFENVAKSYHQIALQNYMIIIEGKCKDVHGKHTKKVGWGAIFDTHKQVKFKP